MNPAYVGRRRGGPRRLIWFAFCLILVVYVVRYPSEAAATARTLIAGLDGAVDSIITFIQQAAGGVRA